MNLFRNFARTKTFASALACTMAVTVGFSGVAQADKVKLRGAHVFPETLVQSGVLFETWADELRKASDGNIDTKIVHGGALLSVKDHVDGVASGLVDLVSFYPIYFPGEFRVEGALTNVTDIWSEQTIDLRKIGEIHRTLHSEFDVMQDEYSKRNMRMLTPLPVDPYILVCAEPVKNFADLKGRKIRSFGKYLPILIESIGAQPISLPSSEAYGALSSGLIDCIYSTPSFIYVSKFHEVGPYVYIPGVEGARPQALCTAVFAINTNSYDKLSDENKKILNDVSENMINVAGEVMTSVYEDSVAALVEATGNAAVHMTEEEFQNWRASTPNMLDRVATDLDEAGYPGSEIIARYRELAAASFE